jgi:predicted acylesterase/phospholipase RssA
MPECSTVLLRHLRLSENSFEHDATIIRQRGGEESRRYNRRKSIGVRAVDISLALGGGGSKGHAHIGVIRQPEAEGYTRQSQERVTGGL